MNRPELYHKTVSILVDAYFNDTLSHGSCTACAVGNIVAANNSYRHRDFRTWEKDGKELPYPGLSDGKPSGWGATVCSELDGQVKRPQHLIGEPLRQIQSTGYSYDDICKIEFAFESARCIDEEDRMFKGLMNVIEALDEIHDNKDPEVSTKSKNRFCKATN